MRRHVHAGTEPQSGPLHAIARGESDILHVPQTGDYGHACRNEVATWLMGGFCIRKGCVCFGAK